MITVTCAVFGSTNNAARTTTLPRSNGPATAGTTIERPNGPPLYGPVKYTLAPCTQNGSGPTPAPTVTVPMRETSEHLPALASASPHSGIPAIFPSKPLGHHRREPRDLLFTVLTRERQRERTEGTRVVVDHPRRDLRAERHTRRTRTTAGTTTMPKPSYLPLYSQTDYSTA